MSLCDFVLYTHLYITIKIAYNKYHHCHCGARARIYNFTSKKITILNHNVN